jgi:hypothetical protein
LPAADLNANEAAASTVEAEDEATPGGCSDRLECDCNALNVMDANGNPLATIPLHQIASVKK